MVVGIWNASSCVTPEKKKLSIDYYTARCCARGRPIIVEWERDARHSAGLSLVRVRPSDCSPSPRRSVCINSQRPGAPHRLTDSLCWHKRYLHASSVRGSLGRRVHGFFVNAEESGCKRTRRSLRCGRATGALRPPTAARYGPRRNFRLQKCTPAPKRDAPARAATGAIQLRTMHRPVRRVRYTDSRTHAYVPYSTHARRVRALCNHNYFLMFVIDSSFVHLRIFGGNVIIWYHGVGLTMESEGGHRKTKQENPFSVGSFVLSWQITWCYMISRIWRWNRKVLYDKERERRIEKGEMKVRRGEGRGGKRNRTKIKIESQGRSNAHVSSDDPNRGNTIATATGRFRDKRGRRAGLAAIPNTTPFVYGLTIKRQVSPFSLRDQLRRAGASIKAITKLGSDCGGRHWQQREGAAFSFTTAASARAACRSAAAGNPIAMKRRRASTDFTDYA
ncbi:hypothetical protein EVAR_19656_1 [Eumeta japonica]|uniref:Uncharacterized protein n=1 Tax=Eumeta variegata TaxID=151549 RepID=A0A4C1V3K4_EUMVA|nr:hypothetical protein EVAR_19656_1 [Eumeta japonica]